MPGHPITSPSGRLRRRLPAWLLEQTESASRRRGIAAGLLLVLVIAGLGVLEGSGTAYVGVLTCAPFLTAIFAMPRDVALVGGAALTIGAAVGEQSPAGFTTAQIVRLAFVVAATALAASAAAVRLRRDRTFAQILDVAQVAQSTILRPVPPAAGPLTMAARYTSATQVASIGGDLYDVANTPHGVRLLIGDVRGKGLDAVRLAGAVLGAFREAAHSAGPDLVDVARQVNASVARHAELEDFVTAAFLQLDVYGRGSIVNCGHPAPLQVTPRGAVLSLEPGPAAPPLGLAAPGDLRAHPFVLPPADRLLLYTDGVAEARDRAGTFFEVSTAATVLAGATLDDALTRLVDAVHEHTGGPLHDDMALLLVEHQVLQTPPAGGLSVDLTTHLAADLTPG